jgi:hypothetical protein
MVEAVRQLTVVVEEIRGQNQALGGGLESLREQMHAGFDRVDRRFEEVDQDIALLKHAVLELKAQGQDHGRQLEGLRTEVRDLAAKKVDRDEVESIVERVVARTAGARG